MLMIDPPCPPELPLHHGDHVLHREKRGFHVDGENPVPIRFRQIDNAADFGNPDIVVEDIDPAMRFHGFVDHGRDLVGFGDIAGIGFGPPAGFHNEISGFLGCPEMKIGSDHHRALFGKTERGRLAVAPSRPGRARAHHDRDFARKAHQP
jgi:hypothetical protein